MIRQNRINLQHFTHEENREPIEIFEWKDPESQKILKIPAKIKTGNEEIDMKVIIGHLNSGIRKVISREVRAKSEGKLKSLQDTLINRENTQVELLTKIKAYNMLLVQKEKEAKRNFQLFREIKIERDIHDALSGFDLKNIEDTILQLKVTGKASLKEESGKYQTIFSFKVNGEEKDFSAKDAVVYYFSDPLNAYQLANTEKEESDF